MSTLSYEQAVSSWAAHLRAGGTTDWHRFREHPAPAPDVDVRPLPDSVHLELVRRLNLAAGGVAHPDLADQVLATVAPGRGRVDIPLPWPDSPPRFGVVAMDPAALPTQELVRLAVGVLARLLPGVPTPPEEPTRPRWPLPWRRRFRLHGSPGTVAAARASLLAQGLVESDWRPTHVVIARPIEVMMAEHWAASVHAGGILRWGTLWRRTQAAAQLPARIDVAAIAARLQDQVGPRRRGRHVHVVVARDAETAQALTAGVLGARPPRITATADPSTSDLSRRLNRLTPLTSGPEQVRALSASLARVLADVPTPGEAPAPVTPEGSLPWARATAEAIREAITEAGYPVHGDPEALLPAGIRCPETIDRDRTLDLAVHASLRAWQLQEGHT
ncbi:MAG: hypothetical protein ABWY19_12085 [Marmoricola sp.]